MAPPPKLGLGVACQGGGQCDSGNCADGVCCESACRETCRSCAGADNGGRPGLCRATTAGRDPHSDCARSDELSCGQDGECNGQGACRLYQGNVCQAAMCSGSTFTPARTCNGGGTCAPSAPVNNCGFFLCTPQGCPTMCQSHGQCSDAGYCDAQAQMCLERKDAGAPCESARECKTTLGCVMLLGLVKQCSPL
jgi:hypothetical protein